MITSRVKYVKLLLILNALALLTLTALSAPATAANSLLAEKKADRAPKAKTATDRRSNKTAGMPDDSRLLFERLSTLALPVIVRGRSLRAPCARCCARRRRPAMSQPREL